MKKIVSLALVFMLVLGCTFALASCNNVSESYAEKLNKAAENGEHYEKSNPGGMRCRRSICAQFSGLSANGEAEKTAF